MSTGYQVGDRVLLAAKLLGYTKYDGVPGVVREVVNAGRVTLFRVHFEGDADDNAQIFGLGSLKPEVETPATKKRQASLRMSTPKDTRTEQQKSDEAKNWLLSLGYEVAEVGRYHKAAVCNQCLSEEHAAAKREQRPMHLKTAVCPVHNKPYFSLHTGSTPGVSDWQVRHPKAWGQWYVLCVEWKRTGSSKRRDDQVRMHEAGWYPIVSSITELAQVIAQYESQNLGITSLPEVLRKAQGGTI